MALLWNLGDIPEQLVLKVNQKSCGIIFALEYSTKMVGGGVLNKHFCRNDMKLELEPNWSA